MPLHDWTDRAGWEGMHHLWISELLRWIKPRLPQGYRAYIGSAPVRSPDPGMALFVERQGRLIAAVELISPRNKDRPVARSTYLGRYLAYLMEAVHLLLIDVHPRPLGFSFADEIAREFALDQPPIQAPSAFPTGSANRPQVADGCWPSGVVRWPSAPFCRRSRCR